MTEWNEEQGDQRYDDRYDDPKSGTGKVLFYFFAAVVLCAVSLGIGYMMGKRSAGPSAVETGAPAAQSAATSGAPKPGASLTADAMPQETAAPEPSPSPVAMTPAKPEVKPATKSTKAPEMATNPAKGFMVQVAAVTRQEDADTLAGALRKKKYPVFVLPPAGNDRFYRVQVGPFAEMKDADAMKAKLAGDGYNAIVKK
jgi:cell division septation protein DedD